VHRQHDKAALECGALMGGISPGTGCFNLSCAGRPGQIVDTVFACAVLSWRQQNPWPKMGQKAGLKSL